MQFYEKERFMNLRVLLVRRGHANLVCISSVSRRIDSSFIHFVIFKLFFGGDFWNLHNINFYASNLHNWLLSSETGYNVSILG